MKKQTGIWIDTKMAVIIFLEDDSPLITHIQSNIIGRERIPGESKWLTRFGNQFLNFEKTQNKRKANEIKKYLDRVMEALKPVNGIGREPGELVLFGPAAMKTELEKKIREHTGFSLLIKGVETTDSMTENQMVAWVRNFYHHSTSSQG